jgi:hypothetical protein
MSTRASLVVNSKAYGPDQIVLVDISKSASCALHFCRALVSPRVRDGICPYAFLSPWSERTGFSIEGRQDAVHALRSINLASDSEIYPIRQGEFVMIRGLVQCVQFVWGLLCVFFRSSDSGRCLLFSRSGRLPHSITTGPSGGGKTTLLVHKITLRLVLHLTNLVSAFDSALVCPTMPHRT